MGAHHGPVDGASSAKRIYEKVEDTWAQSFLGRNVYGKNTMAKPRSAGDAEPDERQKILL